MTRRPALISTLISALIPALVALLSLGALSCAGARPEPVGAVDLLREMRALRRRCSSGALGARECDRMRAELRAWAARDGASSGGEEASWACAFDRGEPSSPAPREQPSFAASAEVDQIIRQIFYAVGIEGAGFKVRSEEVGNAEATIRRGERFLVYNPDFIRRVREEGGGRWAVYAVLAHEIGHHLEGHSALAGGSRPVTEIIADRFAGRILGRLGAPLDDTQAIFRRLAKDGSHTHPSRDLRLAAVREGWEVGHREHVALAGIDEPEPAGSERASSEECRAGQAEAAPAEAAPAEAAPSGGRGDKGSIEAPPEVAAMSASAAEGRIYSATCNIGSEHVYLGADGSIYSADDGRQVGTRQQCPRSRCAAELVTAQGRYCLQDAGDLLPSEAPAEEGTTRRPIGECHPCDAGECRLDREGQAARQ